MTGLISLPRPRPKGVGHDVDIISGATVTIMIIDDSVVRSSIKVARALGLGGLASSAYSGGPTYELNMDETTLQDWQTMVGDGTVRRLTLDVGQINTAFEETGDARVLRHIEVGEAEDTYIDFNLALVSSPSIGRSLLGKNEYNNLVKWMGRGRQRYFSDGPRDLFV